MSATQRSKIKKYLAYSALRLYRTHMDERLALPSIH
jgi:hypothetical protein